MLEGRVDTGMHGGIGIEPDDRHGHPRNIPPDGDCTRQGLTLHCPSTSAAAV
jgi:hypothetical protein